MVPPNRLKVSLITLGVLTMLLVTCAVGQMYCSAPAQGAPAPGVWMCLATTEKTLEPDYDCEAKGFSKKKDVAKAMALVKCEDKCYAECVVEACVRIRK